MATFGVNGASRSALNFDPLAVKIGAHDVAARRLHSYPAEQAADPVDDDFAATLLAIAGHDLRQPLQLITSAHDVLATLVHSDEQREELAHAAEATSRLTGMLGQLVEALQLHDRSREGLAVPVPLRPVLDGLTAEFNEQARRKRVTLRVARADGTALSHPVLLTSILRNLVRNGINYTPAGGTVSIASQQDGPELRIAVRDTGVGMRADVLSRIFDAFERVDSSRGDGLGLGLFIVKRAAELLGHRVEVRSVEGSGSRFTIVTRVAPCGTAEVIRFSTADAVRTGITAIRV